MGSGGVPNRTIIRVNGRSGDLPTTGAKPNSRYDLYENGNLKQSRWFDEKGNVVRNRDYFHQDRGNHYFPHDHNWEWINNQPHRDNDFMQPDYDNYY